MGETRAHETSLNLPMPSVTFESQTRKKFVVEDSNQGDTLAVVKAKFSAQTGIDVDNMAKCVQQGKPLQDEQPVNGVIHLNVQPFLLEYGWLTSPSKSIVPAADGYRGTFMTPHMNDYTHTRDMGPR